MNLTIYLKTICENVDQALLITLPKSNLSLDGEIFLEHDFCMKN
jgi:hypothetical protein